MVVNMRLFSVDDSLARAMLKCSRYGMQSVFRCRASLKPYFALMTYLVHDFISLTASRTPEAEALVYGRTRLCYAELANTIGLAAGSFLAAGIEHGDRVAIYLEKRIETVVAMFGTAAAGGVFVPVNPLLKPAQVTFILNDCNATVLVTSVDRFRLLQSTLPACPDLRMVLVIGADEQFELSGTSGLHIMSWEKALACAVPVAGRRSIDADMAAILYTSGSTGKPKGVVLSHRNLVAGATSVASYLENNAQDRILAVLPLSFDYGLSQLTTAFHAGATAVLMNHLLSRDIVRMVEAERITGLAGVPPLWMQLAQLKWPENTTLRYITNSGGAMPRATLDSLRAAWPNTTPYLMYGLTEAFRSTYLPPAELDARPDSMGKAIPNAEVLVLRPDGSVCAPGEPGELVHRGALVSMGYWNDPQRTAERFRALPGACEGLSIPEIAVWSGDIVRTDEDGFLYFIGRNDDMIKTSGYRVSPTEVEDVIYEIGQIAEAAAIGVPHPTLGQAIVVVIHPGEAARFEPEAVLAACRQQLPAYMVPGRIVQWDGSLPRNPNGKIDRKLLAAHFQHIFSEANS
jgi:acyl-CoA ligase (AMP-forming) (exosortase A-associated)